MDIQKHTPKLYAVFILLGIIYFLIAIYYFSLQLKHFKKVNGFPNLKNNSDNEKPS